jgi:hypothetical protein
MGDRLTLEERLLGVPTVDGDDTGDDGGNDDGGIDLIEDPTGDREPTGTSGWDPGDPDGEEGGEPAPDPVQIESQAPAPSMSRLVRSVANKERELARERQERRVEQQELARLRSQLESRQGPDDRDDPVELLRDWATRRLGLTTAQSSDPRVMELLREATTDLTAEAFEASEGVDGLRQRREERRRRVEEAGRFRSYEQRIGQMEAARQRAEDEARVAGYKAHAAQVVAAQSTKTPFLGAAVEAGDVPDLAQAVMATAVEMVRTGQAPDPTDQTQLSRLYGLIIANMEEHYRGLGERLSARTAAKPAGRLDVRNAGGRSSGAAATSGRTPSRAGGGAGGDGRTRAPARSTRGGGGRGAAGPSTPDDSGDGDGGRLSLAERIERAARAAQRNR